jgi:hypothetical protein
MMADETPIPPRVQALAKQAKGMPFAWREDETSVVIVFVDGRKLTFDLTAQAEETPAAPQPKKGKGK